MSIVLGFDDSDAARAAMEWSADYVTRAGGDVVVVHVVSAVTEWELAAAQINPDPRRHRIAVRLEQEWCEPLRRRGVPHLSRVAVGRVADELMHVAQQVEAEMIVIGMTARGSLVELVNRNTFRQLRGHAVRPVVAVPPAWHRTAGAAAALDRATVG